MGTQAWKKLEGYVPGEQQQMDPYERSQSPAVQTQAELYAQRAYDRNPLAGGPYADGGIVTRPTVAVIGESGPEAIVPLGNRPGAKIRPSSMRYQRLAA